MQILQVAGTLVIMLLLVACSRSQESTAMADAQPGIPLTLATERARTIQGLHYDLSFAIPAAATEPIPGRAAIHFDLKEISTPLVLDFTPGADSITSVSINRQPSKYRLVRDHIIIPKEELTLGENTVEVAFRAGDASLNRNPDFMYTLFVPARAHLAFPCFDQPDLKARYTVDLTVPAAWQAISNGEELRRESSGLQKRILYAETKPIPT